MTPTLRPYQADAVQAIRQAFATTPARKWQRQHD
jgi:superfamily II DNA or RNA helicase